MQTSIVPEGFLGQPGRLPKLANTPTEGNQLGVFARLQVSVLGWAGGPFRSCHDVHHATTQTFYPETCRIATIRIGFRDQELSQLALISNPQGGINCAAPTD